MKRTNDFVVGLTIVLGAVTIVGTTLWVKQTDLRNKHDRITARFRDALQLAQRPSQEPSIQNGQDE